MCLTWWKEPATCIEYAAFFRDELYMLRTHDLITKEVMNFITKQVWVDYVESLK